MAITYIIIALACIWLAAMAWMRMGTKEKAPRWIQTQEGGAWISCHTWPKEGERVRCYGYHGISKVDYNSALAFDGTLELRGGRYIWTSSGRRPYLPR